MSSKEPGPNEAAGSGTARDRASNDAGAAPAALSSSTSPTPSSIEERAEPRFERRWVWMDRWDPGTWEMPSNPTKLQRVLAGLALIIVAVMTIWVPFRMLGVF